MLATILTGFLLVACGKADQQATPGPGIEPVPATGRGEPTAKPTEPATGSIGSATDLTPPKTTSRPRPGTKGNEQGSPQRGVPNSGLGWELTAGNTGLGRVGLSCAKLPVYQGSDRPGAGTVITGQRIESTLDLSAGGITIERSCVQPRSAQPGLAMITTTNYESCRGDSCAVTPTIVTIRDSEIDGSRIDTGTVAKSCAFQGVGTLDRNYIHDVGSGICFLDTGSVLNATATNNFVHKLRAFGDAATTGSHNESFTIRGFDPSGNPARQAVIAGNRFDSSSGNDTGALFIQTYAGNIDHVLIASNLLEGNAYQLILEAGYGNQYGRSMRAVNNRFSGSGYGPAYVDSKGLGYGWSEWRDNYLNDPGNAGHQGQPVSEPR